MSVAMTPALKTKIERRARRAFRRFDEGEQARQHRISGVTKDRLEYRVPRSSRSTVPVVRMGDGTIVVDPPTTGLIDVLVQADIKRLKNHAGEVRAYMLVKGGGANFHVASRYQKKSEPLRSRAQCVDQIEVGDRVFVIETVHNAVALGSYDTSDFTAADYKITAELDPEKDLGFTTGLFDCLTKADVESLRKKKHLGRVRAYKYTTKDAESPIQSTNKIKYEVGKFYEIKDADTGPGSNCHKGINVADAEWCKSPCKGDGNENRIFAFEFDMKDIAAIPNSTDGKFRLHRCLCVDEVDPKTFKSLTPPPMLPAIVEPDPVEPTDKKSKTKGKAKPKADPKPKKKRGIIDKLLGRGKDKDNA